MMNHNLVLLLQISKEYQLIDSPVATNIKYNIILIILNSAQLELLQN